MNIRFTIEEENIIAIYAEDSRERTIDNIISAMPYMDEDMRQLAAAAVSKLQAMTDSTFSETVFTLTDDEEALTKRGRGCRLPAPRPHFLSFQQDDLFPLFLCVPQRRICPAEVAPYHSYQIVAIIHKPPVAGGYCPLIVYIR